MSLLTEIFRNKARTFSLEVFPAKTPEGHAKLLETLKGLCALKPDFISCTYGAGGGSRERTLEVVQHIESVHGIAAMAHLTCVSHTRSEMTAILDDIRGRGISNILAMRGDPPKEQPDWKPGPEHFKYSSELVAYIRGRYQGDVAIGVAGFPEGHPLAADREADARVLREKVRSGADFVITQLFFDNKDYFDYVERLRRLGVQARVIPGVLPVTDYAALLRFCALCGATVTPEVRGIFEPLAGDPQATLKAGIAYAIRQCRALLEGGAPGIHLYTLNRIHPTDAILGAIRPPTGSS
ncbi:MAG: 5,10-methylenetetrahydrofolate reductase [Candidatus Omnitrophica bacterium]|nr:5,10-methylenetetrahydrofolate reductase [Candidatus Omnitrophota bacterium]